MMQHLLAGAVFVVMVLSPCVIATFNRSDAPDTASKSGALDGFVQKKRAA